MGRSGGGETSEKRAGEREEAGGGAAVTLGLPVRSKLRRLSLQIMMVSMLVQPSIFRVCKFLQCSKSFGWRGGDKRGEDAKAGRWCRVSWCRSEK